MLSLFPPLLWLAPLGTTLLRVAVGVTFVIMVYQMYKQSKRMTEISLPMLGKPYEWLILFAAVIIGLVGVSLIVGLLTQLMALLGMLIVIKRTYLRKYYQEIC